MSDVTRVLEDLQFIVEDLASYSRNHAHIDPIIAAAVLIKKQAAEIERLYQAIEAADAKGSTWWEQYKAADDAHAEEVDRG